jgi:hypothetical protein
MKNTLFGFPSISEDDRAQAWENASTERENAVAVLKAAVKPNGADPLAWAHRLRAREIACERLSLFQRSAWREALGYSERER